MPTKEEWRALSLCKQMLTVRGQCNTWDHRCDPTNSRHAPLCPLPRTSHPDSRGSRTIWVSRLSGEPVSANGYRAGKRLQVAEERRYPVVESNVGFRARRARISPRTRCF